ncbi:MAG TPA: glycosyltransferase family protein [Longimicrobium sp.]|nr:glycosyltransferase family protein [Longimicrobium sp.]
MRRVLILQARTTSTRLPGKVLMDLGGTPMMRVQLARLLRCTELDEIVVATTRNATDDPVVRLADEAGVRWFRGSEADVLSRYAGAAREAGADLVVRSTADCPLIEPAVVDRVVRHLADGRDRLDYASNVVRRTYPQGLDVEALFRDTLERVHRMATSAAAREHVTQFILSEHPELFRVGSVTDEADNSDLSWTVDTAEDLDRVRRLYAALCRDGEDASYARALRLARAGLEAGADA